MTKLSKVLCLLTLPLLSVSQSSSGQGSQQASGLQPSQTVLTITSVSSSVGLGTNRQPTTVLRTNVITTTSVIQQATSAPSGNNSVSASGNATSSTSTKPLPTAPTNISGGGGANGAPLPGATGGAYGPDDSYIAAAQALKRNTYAVGLCGLLVGGAMILV